LGQPIGYDEDESPGQPPELKPKQIVHFNTPSGLQLTVQPRGRGLGEVRPAPKSKTNLNLPGPTPKTRSGPAVSAYVGQMGYNINIRARVRSHLKKPIYTKSIWIYHFVIWILE
jgi:hypothetical protein